MHHVLVYHIKIQTKTTEACSLNVKISADQNCSGRIRTFVVKDSLHLHGRPGVGDAQHGAGDQALQGRRAVRRPHQAPVGFVVATLQDLDGLTSSHIQLVAVAGHEVVDHHSELTAAGELRKRRPRSEFSYDDKGSDSDSFCSDF